MIAPTRSGSTHGGTAAVAISSNETAISAATTTGIALASDPPLGVTAGAATVASEFAAGFGLTVGLAWRAASTCRLRCTRFFDGGARRFGFAATCEAAGAGGGLATGEGGAGGGGGVGGGGVARTCRLGWVLTVCFTTRGAGRGRAVAFAFGFGFAGGGSGAGDVVAGAVVVASRAPLL
jgi:hypothetical protein